MPRTGASQGGNRGEKTRNRSDGAARLENTSDYTSTYHAGRVSPRIPGQGQFSRRTEKNALVDGDNAAPDSGTSAAAIGELFTPPGAPYVGRRASNESINYDVTPGRATTKSGSLEGDAFALLSKIVLSETLSATERSEGLRCGFRTVASVSGNVNASGSAPPERRDLSALAIRNDNARDERREGDANASARIPVAAAFTRSRDPPTSAGEIPTEEPSAATIRARAREESWTVAPPMVRNHRGSSSSSSSPASERTSRRSSASSRDSQDPRGISNSPGGMSKVVNLKNSYGFAKPRGKLRKWWKGAEKFRGGNSRRHGDLSSSRGSRRDRREVANETSARRRRYLPPGRLRRHLRNAEEELDSAVAEDGRLDSRRKTQVFVDHHARPKVPHFQILKCRTASFVNVNSSSLCFAI